MSSVYLDRYTAFVLRYRWLVIASTVAVMLVLMAGLQFITASNDWRDNLDKNNPQLVAFDNLEDTYSATNAAVIAVAPKGGAVFTREALGAVEELTEAAWRVPWSTRVDSLTNYYHSEAVEDDLNVERLVDDAGSLSDDDLARIKEIALGEISIAGRLVSHDGRVAGLVMSFALPKDEYAAVIQISDYLHGLLDEARADHPDIGYHLTGDVFVNHVMTEAADDDMGILAPDRIPRHRVRRRHPSALPARHAVPRPRAHLRYRLDHGRHRLGRPGAQRRQLRRSDYHHDDGHRTLGPRRRDDHVRYEARSGQGRRGRRIATRQCLADVPDDGHDDDRIPQPERLGLSAFSVLGNLVAFGMLSAFVYSMTLLPALLLVLPLRARPVRAGRSAFFDRFGAFVVARRTLLLWSMPWRPACPASS